MGPKREVLHGRLLTSFRILDTAEGVVDPDQGVACNKCVKMESINRAFRRRLHSMR